MSNFKKVRSRRTIDGDTFNIEGTNERVRLIGLDAPEIGEPGADEATEFLRKKTEGNDVWLEFEGAEKDRFGRFRAYVWLKEPKDVKDEQEMLDYQINAMLLKEGLASVFIVGEVRNEKFFTRICKNKKVTYGEDYT